MRGRRDTGYSLAEAARTVAPTEHHPVMSRGVGWERQTVNVVGSQRLRYLVRPLHRLGPTDEPWSGSHVPNRREALSAEYKRQ